MPIPHKNSQENTQEEKIEPPKNKKIKLKPSKDPEDKYKEKNINENEDLILDQALEDIYDFGNENNSENQNKNKQKNISLGIYRKIAFTFIFLTIALLAVISYFALVKVQISVTPAKEEFNSNLIFDLYDEEKIPADASAMKGVVKEIEISDEQIYFATGKKILSQNIVGKVTLINKYNKSQPLVASTRLLSPDNKLYRLKQTVEVPAGASVEAEVYADKVSPEMAIGPTHFTIPGLWSGIQDKIYAESEADFTYKEDAELFILDSDIENALSAEKTALSAKAVKEIDDEYGKYSNLIYQINPESVILNTEAKSGDKKGEFKVSGKAKVLVVAFDSDKLFELAKSKIGETVPVNKKLIGLDKESFGYNLDNYSLEDGKASISTKFKGLITFNDQSNILEKEKLLGLTKAQIEDYLSSRPDIESFEVKFYPPFIKKVSHLADRIIIEIK